MQREASTIGNANPDTGAASAHNIQQFEMITVQVGVTQC